MKPVLTAAAGLCRAESEALKHGSLLLKGVIVALAAAEAVAEVLVIAVVDVGLLRMHSSLCICLVVCLQRAGGRGWEARRAAVTGKVALLEYLDERVLAVALDRARVADPRWRPRVGWRRWRRVACQTGKDALSEGSENSRAVVDALLLPLAM